MKIHKTFPVPLFSTVVLVEVLMTAAVVTGCSCYSVSKESMDSLRQSIYVQWTILEWICFVDFIFMYNKFICAVVWCVHLVTEVYTSPLKPRTGNPRADGFKSMFPFCVADLEWPIWFWKSWCLNRETPVMESTILRCFTEVLVLNRYISTPSLCDKLSK